MSTFGAVVTRGRTGLVQALGVYYPNETLSAATGITEQNFTQTHVLPANFFTTRTTVRVTATFILTSSATPPTARLKLKLGSTILYDGGATSPGANNANVSVALGVLLQGTAAPGAAANVEGGFLSPAAQAWPLRMAIAQPVAVATNAAQAITLSVQYSATTAGNSLRLASLVIEQLQ